MVRLDHCQPVWVEPCIYVYFSLLVLVIIGKSECMHAVSVSVTYAQTKPAASIETAQVLATHRGNRQFSALLRLLGTSQYVQCKVDAISSYFGSRTNQSSLNSYGREMDEREGHKKHITEYKTCRNESI